MRGSHPDAILESVATELNGVLTDMRLTTLPGNWKAFYQNIADVLVEGKELAVRPEEIRRVEGPGERDQSASLRYFPQDREAVFILLCTALPRSDLVIRTHQRTALRDRRIALRLPTPRV